MHQPETPEALCALIAALGEDGHKAELRGGGTRTDFGAPDRKAEVLSLAAFSGITEYDAAELVLSAGAGTPLAEIQAALAAKGQHLAFEPWGHDVSTIGGVIASGTAGSRRVSAGSVRDHLLGFTAVSGRGESFVAGAKVVKNVTGYDLAKLMCGSWGRLAALTEVTLKVLPAPPERLTLAWEGLGTADAFALLRAAMRLPADVAAAAHDPQTGQTLVRIEGFGPSVAARQVLIARDLAAHGAPRALSEGESGAAWARVAGGAALADAPVLWRLSVQPRLAKGVVDRLCASDACWLADWAGGLLWIASGAPADVIRAGAQAAGGHAALINAPAELRARIPALQPQAPALAALEARVRRAFDPLGVFETGRFLDTSHAD